jgi:phosphoglycolate phosphatase
MPKPLGARQPAPHEPLIRQHLRESRHIQEARRGKATDHLERSVPKPVRRRGAGPAVDEVHLDHEQHGQPALPIEPAQPGSVGHGVKLARFVGLAKRLGGTDTAHSMRQPTVLLFDIDGTLLSSSGAGRRAMERALAQVHGGEGACRFSFDGMTDRAIVRRALCEVGLASDGLEPTIDRVLEAYLAYLAEELVAPGDYRVYPGVRELLEASLEVPRLALGLGTGNIRRGAALKLGRVQLDGYFAFGGFGCDHEQRAQIIKVGAERGAARLGVLLAACRVAVIGDTPRDVAAALATGAEGIGVATGRYSVSELMAAGATRAFETLAEREAHEHVLRG